MWCRLFGDPPGTNFVRAACDLSPPAPTNLLSSLRSLAALWESSALKDSFGELKLIVSKFGYTQHSANIFASAFVCTNFPVVASGEAGTATGSLYNVGMSTADAVSYKCEDVSFKVTVNAPETGVDEVKGENGEVKTIYDLQGRQVENPTKGIYIINGKQVLIK